MIVFDGSAVKLVSCRALFYRIASGAERSSEAGGMIEELTYHHYHHSRSVRCLGGTRPTEFGRNGPCLELKNLWKTSGSQEDLALRQR